MNDLILIKSGALGDKEEMPRLNYREFGYRTDTEELFIGTENGNERLCGVKDLAEINNKINNIMAEITKINGDLKTINSRLDALEKPSE